MAGQNVATVFNAERTLEQALHKISSMRKVLDNPRIIIPRVLLYNDGGFDLSADGKILSACAEYWLPEGVNNAMELLQSQQELEEEEEDQRQRDLVGFSAGGDATPL